MFLTRLVFVVFCQISVPIFAAPKAAALHNKNANIFPKECGVVVTTDKIGFGSNAELNEFPWMAALMLRQSPKNSSKFHCAGTIITENYILTAAHCVSEFKPPDLTVRLGEHNFKTNPDCMKDEDVAEYCTLPYEEVQIERIKVHADFNRNVNLLSDDIALIKTKSKMKFNNQSIKPVCLPVEEKSVDADLSNLILTGWGSTEKNELSEVLQKATVSLCEYEQCQLFYDTQYLKDRKLDLSKDKHLCTNGKSYSCFGDSGGPLHVPLRIGKEVRFVQFGITSFGPQSGCGSFTPMVNTRILPYMGWIIDNVST